jgi:hypothetical protein
LWRTVQADEDVPGELRAFGEAVEWRFRAEAVRALQRSEGGTEAVIDPSVAPDRVATLTAGVKDGRRAAVAVTQRDAETARRGLGL